MGHSASASPFLAEMIRALEVLIGKRRAKIRLSVGFTAARAGEATELGRR